MKTPLWFILLLVLAALPMCFLAGTASDVLAGSYGAAAPALSWFYPVYILLAGACAWICWPQRRALAWVLFGMMILTDLLLLLCL